MLKYSENRVFALLGLDYSKTSRDGAILSLDSVSTPTITSEMYLSYSITKPCRPVYSNHERKSVASFFKVSNDCDFNPFFI